MSHVRGFHVIYKLGHLKSKQDKEEKTRGINLTLLVLEMTRWADRQSNTLNNNGPRLCIVKERRHTGRGREGYLRESAENTRRTTVETRPRGCGGEAETQREPAPIIDREARMMVVIEYEGHQEGERSIKRQRLYITRSHDQNNKKNLVSQ